MISSEAWVFFIRLATPLNLSRLVDDSLKVSFVGICKKRNRDRFEMTSMYRKRRTICGYRGHASEPVT